MKGNVMAEVRRETARGRVEDERLLRGQGRYTADIPFENLAYAVVVRAPHAHARLLGIALEEAQAAPGVLGVFTAADLAADGLPDIPASTAMKRADGTPSPSTARPVLARDRVRFLGEGYALVVAESLAAAIDAAELVVGDFDELPVAATLEEATREDAPAVWDEAPDNCAFVWRKGERAALEEAFADARHVVRQEIRISRVHANPMEPRAAVGAVAPDGRLELHISHQTPFPLRDALARDLFKLPPGQLRVVAPDVGGSFGMKLGIHPEEVLVLWAARRLGRPVRWVADRSEAFLADDHGRDVRMQAALALDEALNFVALDVTLELNLGCYVSSRSLASVGNVGGIAGVYRTPLIGAEIRGVLSHSVPTGPYRGAGRPEATYAIERLIDIAARQLAVDPFELRRRNLIPKEAMPFQTALTFAYDCGDFAENMKQAAAAADLAGFPARRAAALAEGKLRGLGIANCIEAAGGPYGNVRKDGARLSIAPDGTITLDSGVMSTGQGLETALPGLVAEGLGIGRDRIRFVQGDTDRLADGRGSGGSSALTTGGTAVTFAVEKVIEKGRAIAAHHFEAAPADVEFAAGRFTVVGTDRTLDLAAVATLAADPAALPEGMAPGLDELAEFQPSDVTYPNGCHLCEVEIEQETGRVRVVNYVAAEDIGTVLYPTLVHGQIHGGVVQGIGQAVGEAIVYQEGSGQLTTGSFNDYAMPVAAEIPPIRILSQPVPTALNPLGAKGVGEAGTVGALAATMNAVCDALAPLGVRHLDMPASPLRVWQALQEAAGR